jgi:crotonobetainyl-CoA:carnitine CoA-transferase CaiB-like acyl-CoA transferase
LNTDGNVEKAHAQGSEAEETTGALSGIIVADFSRVLAGPLATMMLGDLGATVI